ncbi:MAG TPA: hypothetical protein VLE19_06345, partial [Pyrinomonadaceae bacterium]|nr:hypothetical protein [Pyrinomonadaceae bacterium]
MTRSKKPGDPRLQNIPSVDQILRTETAIKLVSTHGINKVTALARNVAAAIRSSIRANSDDQQGETPQSLLEEA